VSLSFFGDEYNIGFIEWIWLWRTHILFHQFFAYVSVLRFMHLGLVLVGGSNPLCPFS
jgi:hypothetical protein